MYDLSGKTLELRNVIKVKLSEVLHVKRITGNFVS
jgi:hypothetical protein